MKSITDYLKESIPLEVKKINLDLEKLRHHGLILNEINGVNANDKKILLYPVNSDSLEEASFASFAILKEIITTYFDDKTPYVGQSNEEAFEELSYNDRNLNPDYPIIGIKLKNNKIAESVEEALHEDGCRWGRSDRDERYVGKNQGANKDDEDPASDIVYVAVCK